jgi:hypothetical protein
MHVVRAVEVRFGRALNLRLLAPSCFVLVAACSRQEERAEKQRECEALADEIREEARLKGIPSQESCNREKAPALVEDCDRLSECNRQLAELR